jgi:hypothetical protein
MNKITFRPMTQAVTNFSVAPVPAKQALPQWYKEASPYVYDEKEIGMHPNPNAGISNATIKACVPFLDAMTTGYMITLVSDIELRKTDKKEILIRWSQPYLNMVEGHHPDQIETLPFENGEFKTISKWLFDWKIETPPGYSCLYTHPINRHDLPFRTFSGVVDTDTFPDAVHFPFSILNFEGDRTPICQVFPFKRDEWQSEVLPLEPYLKEKATFSILKVIGRSYKRQFWHKKTYN